MSFLLAVFWGLPRVWLDLRFCYKSASPRFDVELPRDKLFFNELKQFTRRTLCTSLMMWRVGFNGQPNLLLPQSAMYAVWT